ncbi:hypothetical protein IWQ60_004434 [Tieghemiomyces parasiticus]|uniref:Uncharacterized protein n=1 Tax=Tieghemiomyces parasiticus TaxID=78921 RepID=A0A9W8DTX1_9FUNG|nr:hypothetical protein IWQ60_004434 [Tieghemiomyces parasiticus]
MEFSQSVADAKKEAKRQADYQKSRKAAQSDKGTAQAKSTAPKTLDDIRKKKMLKRKRAARAAERQEGEFRDFSDLKDPVRFNEQVDAPPVFRKLPRATGKVIMPGETKLTAVKPRPQSQQLPSSASASKNSAHKGLLLAAKLLTPADESVNATKAKAKAKVDSLSRGEKRALEVERERAVALYRQRKAAVYEKINQARNQQQLDSQVEE